MPKRERRRAVLTKRKTDKDKIMCATEYVKMQGKKRRKGEFEKKPPGNKIQIPKRKFKHLKTKGKGQ